MSDKLSLFRGRKRGGPFEVIHVLGSDSVDPEPDNESEDSNDGLAGSGASRGDSDSSSDRRVSGDAGEKSEGKELPAPSQDTKPHKTTPAKAPKEKKTPTKREEPTPEETSPEPTAEVIPVRKKRRF